MLRNRSLRRSRMGCFFPVLALVFGVVSPAYAATPNTDQAVNQIAGQVADSVKQKHPPAQPKNDVGIEVKENRPETPGASAGPKVKVRGFRITGQSLYSEDKLQDMVKDAIDKELTIGELKLVAGRISQYFHAHGFVVANAYIPAQKLTDGIVEIVVMPGKYSGVDIRNNSKLSDAAAARYLSNIKSGEYVKRSKLERTLLLLSDNGGISIKPVLAPGKSAGTAELIVDIEDADLLTGDLSLNNYGNRITGSDPCSLDLSFNDASGQGDVLSVGYSNAGGGMHNYRMNYIIPYGGQGWRLGVNYARLNYALEQEYAPLLAHGISETIGVFGQYPIVRSRNYDLYGQIGVASRRLVDDIDFYGSSNRRKAEFLTLGLSGDSRDSHGVNFFALNVETGRLKFTGGQDILGTPWQTDDAQGARTAGCYTKANFTFNRLQRLNDRLNFFLSFTGQLASKNLDSSEKLYLGGGYGVRAYAQGEASGDEGYILTGELRYNLPIPKLQVAAFIDAGHVSGSKNRWEGGDPSRTLSGAGLGLILNSQKKYSMRVDYAWKLSSGKDTTEAPDKHGRWWLSGIWCF